jgi:hypothetical protein
MQRGNGGREEISSPQPSIDLFHHPRHAPFASFYGEGGTSLAGFMTDLHFARMTY